jgi:hypothetical protein
MKFGFSRMVAAAATVMTIGLMAAPAAADFNRIGSNGPGGWRLLAQTGPKGARVRCIISRSLKANRLRISTDGTKTWLAVQRKGPDTRRVGINIDGWHVARNFKSDGVWTYAAIGPRILNRIARGNSMYMNFPNHDVRVSLLGTSLAISRLKRCATHIRNPGTGFSDRAAQQANPAARPGPDVNFDDSTMNEDTLPQIPEDTGVLPPADDGTTPMPTPPAAEPTMPGAPDTTGGAQMGVGCPAVGDVTSTATDTAVTVTFDVRTAADGLTLYWLDGDGNPLQLGPLVAGVQTVDGHVGDAFVARDSTGACIGGVMQVSEALSSFVVQ